jgi:hypothetical protein
MTHRNRIKIVGYALIVLIDAVLTRQWISDGGCAPNGQCRQHRKRTCNSVDSDIHVSRSKFDGYDGIQQ